MNQVKKSVPIPPIIKFGAWSLSLIVFAVGFWHTHLGLKEMKPFGTEWGGLAIAGIVLLLLLITYWFAVNGNNWALIFYIMCGFVFFICNLNYFYPSYMARTLIQKEASVLNDTLQKYSNGTAKIEGAENSEAVSDYLNLISLKNQIVTEINNNGYGPNAKRLTVDFNSKLSKYAVTPIPVSPSYGRVTNNQLEAESQRKQIEPTLDEALGTLMLKGILNVANPDLFREGTTKLASLKDEYTDILNGISSDNETEYNLDSIKDYENVKNIVTFVGKLNTTIDEINKGNNKDKPILSRLDEDIHSRADKLGMIKYTILSIKERIREIDTWAIIILCLFIDLLVPLAIYLLLRKKDKDDGNRINFKSRPTEF
jgi:hypothetical protein